MFTDPSSSFTTSDVYDVQDQIVRFDTAGNALIWAATGRSGHLFQGGVRYFFNTTGKMKPWIHGMLGASRFSSDTGGSTDFAFTPGIGVDTPLNDTWSFRAQVDFPFISGEDSTAKGMRIGVGVRTTLGGK